MGPLSKSDAERALQSPVRANQVEFENEAIEAVIEKTCGYPYFIQQWGHEAWNIAEASPISLEDVRKASTLAIENLDKSFFRVRFDRLTPRERDYLRALANLGSGNQRSGDISAALGVKQQSVAPIRSSLIKKGMIYSPEYGDTAFTVPLFDAFMIRTMPKKS